MKNRSIKIMSLITCLLMLFYSIMPNVAYALENGKPELKVTTDKSTIKRGEEITVTVSLNTNSNKNVSSIQTVLFYDSDVFEVSKISRGIRNILSQEEQDSGNETETYLANTDIVGQVNVTYSVTRNFDYNGTVYQLTLRAKQDAKIGQTTFAIQTDGETYPIQDGINNKPIESTITDATVEVILPLESISLTSSASELMVGETANLTVKYTPEGTNQKGVTYTSSDEKVATVSNGVVTAVGKGTATITATGANNTTSSVIITVKQPVTGVTLNKKTLELEKHQTEK